MQEMTTDTPDIAANDLVMSKDMAEALHAAYPGHLWAVQVQGAQGICTIRNLALSGNWGFVINLTKVYSASDFKRQVLGGGGEMLERYRLRRGAVDFDAMSSMALDSVGNVLGDKSR